MVVRHAAAMLKGWLDRVWVPGVAFDLGEGGKRIRPRLQNVRLMVRRDELRRALVVVEARRRAASPHPAARHACALRGRLQADVARLLPDGRLDAEKARGLSGHDPPPLRTAGVSVGSQYVDDVGASHPPLGGGSKFGPRQRNKFRGGVGREAQPRPEKFFAIARILSTRPQGRVGEEVVACKAGVE